LTEPAPPAAAPRVGQDRRPPVKRPWPRLPWWFVTGAVVAIVAFLVVGAVAIHGMTSFREQPLYERRSAPLPGEQSHRVGRVELPDAPLVDVRCGAVTGLKVQAGNVTAPLLTEALTALCNRIAGLGTYGTELAERIAALGRAGAVISFANFGRTGELTTTLAGPPPRVLLSDAFLRGGGQYKGFLQPELAHELWHGGRTDVTAEEELAARRVELAACKGVPSYQAFRGCTDAQRIVAAGDAAALAGLRAAGYR
jgi:hypothetical protein